MAITDELRHYIEGSEQLYGCEYKHSRAIADRIDEEHERGVADARNDALYHANDKDMADLGWVRLPKDADGEYVHIGDVMVYADVNTCPMKAVALVPPAVFLTEDGPRYADMCRHKPPTVEDVLEEYRIRYYNLVTDMDCGNITNGEYVHGISKLNAEYAAKLRLAGGAE